MESLPWLANYPKGVPHEINPEEYPSLIEFLEDSFQKYGSRVAYECMGASITYSDLDAMTRQFAAYLQNHTSLQPGDRVAIQMPNVLQYPVAMFGVIRAGMIVVNTNPLYTEREMEHQFNDSGAKALVIMANFADKLEKILPKTKLEKVFITEIGDLLPFPKNLLVNAVVKHVKKMVPHYKLSDSIPFKRALRIGANERFSRVSRKIEDIAFLQYTGGTTGVSKGAMLSHRNIMGNLQQMYAWLGPYLESATQEIVITALPLYHIFSLTVNCMLFTKLGGKNVLITNPRDMDGFLKELQKYKFTVFTGVNTLFNGLLSQAKFNEVNWKTLKVCVAGGMALQRAVAEKWKAKTGTTVIEGYGLTEASPVLSCNPLDGNDRVGSIGMPMPSTVIRIINEDGKDVAQGERGELCAKGPQVMEGYWQRPEESEKTMYPGNWLRTGDIAIMESDGYFKIVDRLKDMILVSGFNVFPNEVEDVIAQHPKVLEVAAIGVPDSKSSEAVKVFIVKSDDSLTVDEIKNFCKQEMTGYKVPKHYEFRTELPKTNVGKILRRALKEEEMAKHPQEA